MWKDIIEFIKETSIKENNKELMSYYIEYVIPFNPFKWVKNSPPNKISDDVLKIKKIQNTFSDSPTVYKEICKQKFRSVYIRDNIQNCEKSDANMSGINTIIKNSEKYIEMTFILRSIEKIHNYERIKSVIAILLAILTFVATIKITIVKICH